jgi:hypothetical protein
VKKRTLQLLLVAWALAVLTSAALMWRYKMDSGEVADAPLQWPADITFARSMSRPTLVMIAHPKCSCTRASIAELERLLSQSGDHADVHVLFVRPLGTPDGWERTDTYARASQIPGVHVHTDASGVMAHRFGAHTSGETLLYGADGALAYHGGITGARGHEGGNVGRDRVLALLSGSAPDRNQSPTFGCDIAEKQARQ